jgi:FkbM family methyltransferase
MPYALGSIKGKVNLLWGASTLSGKINEQESQCLKNTVEVEITTLDDILSERDILFIDILKLDVEGNELEVLKGATETLKNTKKIVLEYHSEGSRNACESFLREKGFGKSLEIPGHQYYINYNCIA